MEAHSAARRRVSERTIELRPSAESERPRLVSGRLLRRVCAATLLLALATLSATCSPPLDLCTPQSANLEFFSKGDCQLTRSSFFQGHEWLTWFGNLQNTADQRFSAEEAQIIAEGNRRVDWPKEFLIHMNAGVLQYAEALSEYTDRPEVQRFHFLLDDKNDSAGAVADARGELRRLTLLAIDDWTRNPTRALTQVGRANHLIQDSFSPAHARRDTLAVEKPWCIIAVKAFIERADGHDDPGIEFHGGTDEDTVGHTTSQDSIYREGRDCIEPASASEVQGCLSEPARRAIQATADYLLLVRQLATGGATGDRLEQSVDAALLTFNEEHLSLCAGG